MNRRSIMSAAATAGVVAAAVAIAGPASAGVTSGACTPAQLGNASVSTFAIPTFGNDPFLVASTGSGATGSLVFTARGGNSVQRYTPATNAFSVLTTTNVQAPQGIAVSADGSTWFTNGGQAANSIGKIATNGTATSYAIPTANANPWGITQGSDGNMWFTEYNASKVGRITPAGVITEFTSPVQTPLQIVSGSDGRLWTGDFEGNSIAATSTSGAFQIYNLDNDVQLNGMTVGPDGNVWFLDQQYSNPAVGVITPLGISQEFPIGVANAAPAQIAPGPAGSNTLWFTQGNGNIGKVTTAGVVTSYPATSTQANPNGIVTGPDGALWFTEGGCSALGRITTAPRVFGTMNSRPSTMRRGKTYTIKANLSAKGKVQIRIVGNGKSRVLVNATGKKGVTNVKVTVPKSLPKAFLGKVTLVMNSSPGSTANKAAQTAPVTVK